MNDFSIEQITYQLTWHVRQQVMWPDKPLDFVILPEDESGVHFAVWENRQIVSVVSLFINGKSAQFRKLCTLPEKQGKGYASALIGYIIQHLNHEEVEILWCNARIEKIRFYQKLKMQPSNNLFEKHGQHYTVMTLKLK